MNSAKPSLSPPSLPSPVILFFDGECGFCHRGMRFFMKRDTRRALRYASLQSPKGQVALTQAQLPQDTFSTLLYLKGTEIKIRSDAILATLRELSLGWKLVAYFLAIIPKPIRDLVYDWLAKYRRVLPYFKNACKVPTPEERKWFIDF